MIAGEGCPPKRSESRSAKVDPTSIERASAGKPTEVPSDSFNSVFPPPPLFFHSLKAIGRSRSFASIPAVRCRDEPRNRSWQPNKRLQPSAAGAIMSRRTVAMSCSFEGSRHEAHALATACTPGLDRPDSGCLGDHLNCRSSRHDGWTTASYGCRS